MPKLNLRNKVPSNIIRTIFNKDLQILKDEARQPQVRVQNISWPSEASVQIDGITIGECRRALFYRIIGVKETDPMTLIGQGICDAGNLYEKYHIDKFKKHGIFLDEQVAVEFLIPNSRNSIQIRGRIDCIVQNEDGSRDALELKSISEYKAAKIIDGVTPLPAAHNLMQAMLYKYYLSQTEQGKQLHVDNVYLMYINRSNGMTFFYRVDLDEEGWPIITAFDFNGEQKFEINLKEVPSFSDLWNRSEVSTSDEARLAELKINIKDIFDRFDSVYDFTTNKMLPECDFKLVYDMEDIEREYKLGRISKIKYNKAKKGEPLGDSKCMYCAFKVKCMKDSGITFK